MTDRTFEGSLVALITPFRNGAVDFDALERNVDEQIAAGTNGLVPCGTTGECPTLSPDEHREVIRCVVARSHSRVPVIAGTGANCTSRAAALTRAAVEAGADGALVVSPYYNKPTPDGLVEHYRAISRAAPGLPIVLYNVPGRTGSNLLPETVERLAREVPAIVAIKEASGIVDQTSEILVRTDLTVLSGDDGLTLPLMAVGARGVVSVLANVAPAENAALVNHALAGRLEEARTLHLRLFPLARALFVESNPIPVKAALRMLGRDTGEVRLPLVPLSERHRLTLAGALEAAGLAVPA